MNFPEWDKDLFVYLNSKNIPWLDSTMLFLSNYYIWVLICLSIAFFIAWKDKKRGRKGALFLVGGVVATLLLNNIIKLFIMRPRPGYEESIKEFIYLLESLGKTSSFFSAHSSSSMCLALFTTLYFKNKLYGVVIFVWACAVAYSRIYVGKHYPLDVFVGVLFGLLMGYLSYRLYAGYMKKHSRLN